MQNHFSEMAPFSLHTIITRHSKCNFEEGDRQTKMMLSTGRRGGKIKEYQEIKLKLWKGGRRVLLAGWLNNGGGMQHLFAHLENKIVTYTYDSWILPEHPCLLTNKIVKSSNIYRHFMQFNGEGWVWQVICATTKILTGYPATFYRIRMSQHKEQSGTSVAFWTNRRLFYEQINW